MRPSLALSLAFLLGCSDGQKALMGPQGLDPTVLASNPFGPDTLRMTWFDQSGQVATFLIPLGQSQCIHFTSTLPADSVRFIAALGASSLDTLPGAPNTMWSKTWSPWFDPQTGLPTANPSAYPFGAENWTLTVPEAWILRMAAVDGAPC